MPLQGGSGWVRFGLPGVVLGLALAGWRGGEVSSVQAQGPGGGGANIPLPMLPSGDRARSPVAVAAGETGGTVVLSTPVGTNGQLLYLIDTKTKALAIYRVDPSNPKGMLKLEATRQYQWDLKLSEYNNLPPEVASIESSVKSLGPQSSR